jgi:hypothetical protein
MLFFHLVDDKWIPLFKLLIIASFFCCLGTISRSSTLGCSIFLVCFSLFTNVNAYIKNKRFNVLIKQLSIIFLIIPLLCIGVYFVIHSKLWGYLPELRRFSDLIGSVEARNAENWSKRITLLKTPIDFFCGLGFAEAHCDITTGQIAIGMGFDSQYIYQLLVSGVFGTVIWFLILLYFIFYFRDNLYILEFYLSLLITYLTISVGYEAFELSKSGFLFWATVGMLCGLKENYYLSLKTYRRFKNEYLAYNSR